MEETASEEILEECGYAVPPDRLALIGAYASAIGISGSSQHIFFAEVDEGMKVGPAGGGGLAAATQDMPPKLAFCRAPFA